MGQLWLDDAKSAGAPRAQLAALEVLNVAAGEHPSDRSRRVRMETARVVYGNEKV